MSSGEPPPSPGTLLLNVFAKPTKSGGTSPRSAATFNFPGRQPAKKAIVSEKASPGGRRQATWKLAQGRVPHTHTNTHTLSHTHTHKLKLPALVLVEAFFDSSQKILTRTWYAAYNQYLHTNTYTETERTFAEKYICAENKNDRPKFSNCARHIYTYIYSWVISYIWHTK